jgi:SAM-dependent methyltransferase
MNVQATPMTETPTKRFLHVGCGYAFKDRTPFQTNEWEEIRIDVDPEVKPDLIGSMTDMSVVGDGDVDALFSSHSLEHVWPHEVEIALREFSRVLNDDGFAIITVPDLQAAAVMIAEGKILDKAYDSPAGPVTPFDIVYSHRKFTATGNIHMLHKCGFTQDLLRGTLLDCGFATVATKARPAAFDLWAVASKSIRSDEEITAIANAHFPAG